MLFGDSRNLMGPESLYLKKGKLELIFIVQLLFVGLELGTSLCL